MRLVSAFLPGLGDGVTYFVSLVVVLGVVFEDLGPLLVVKGADQLLDSDLSVGGPPLFAVDEPGDCQYTLR